MYILLDKDFMPLNAVDEYDSAIWAERHREYGDFELYGRPEKLLAQGVTTGRYLTKQGSDRVMFIQSINIDEEVDEGVFVTATGKSLESMLMRRVVWPPINLNGTISQCVRTLLESTFIRPDDAKRHVPDFLMRDPADAYIAETEMSAQFAGETVYDAVTAICEVYDIGFKIIITNGIMEFILYRGEDRSFKQTANPYVVFSPDFDNLASASYSHSVESLATFTYVSGEEREDSTRITTEVDLGLTGLDRIELFVDASDIRSVDADGNAVSDEEYAGYLEERGFETLAENTATEFFEGSMDTHGTYVYGRDFFLGDTVQIQNDIGISASSQVLEIVYTKDSTGESIVPTFSTPIMT